MSKFSVMPNYAACLRHSAGNIRRSQSAQESHEKETEGGRNGKLLRKGTEGLLREQLFNRTSDIVESSVAWLILLPAAFFRSLLEPDTRPITALGSSNCRHSVVELLKAELFSQFRNAIHLRDVVPTVQSFHYQLCYGFVAVETKSGFTKEVEPMENQE